MIDLESNLDYDKIQKIDLDDLSLLIEESEFRNYFISNPGLEHYKLLAYISSLYNDTTLIELGTYKGCSALALSYNGTNTVHSFDIQHGLRRLTGTIPENIVFHVEDILDEKFHELLHSSQFIFLDTNHDGIFERTLLNYLIKIGWTGYLLLDDISLNDEMKEFWNSIVFEKFDISKYGHHSGTGLVKITY